VTRRLALLAALVVGWASPPTDAQADHALEFFPSYYPHEIRIEAVTPASAAKRLSDNSTHAYIGEDPFAGGAVPAHLGHGDSLESFLVLTFNPMSGALGDRESRCTAGAKLLAMLPREHRGYIFHPYPVTPYHMDYLQHFDLAEAAKKQHEPRPGQSGPALALKIQAKGKLAEKLVLPEWRRAGKGWEATVEEITLDNLLAPSRISLNGWLGPPWLKEGWFHAYLLLAGTLRDGTAKQATAAIYQRLLTGAYDGQVERLNLERRLVSLLRGGCERMVVGYTVRREYFNRSDYSEGVENIAYDSQDGFNSPIFIRTVKLKDFMWNGWLRLGVESTPEAAWNPLGGFSDLMGRLIWSAVGDPAEFPSPYGSSWVANRVTSTVTTGKSPSGGVEIPKDALVPEPGTGLLKPVGEGKTARAKILYRVRASSFHDKSPMTAADLLYPLSFAFRSHDPFVDASTALLRDWLAGVKVLRAEQDVKDFGETKYTFQVQIVEVYVNHALADPLQLASVAAPWSALPWNVIVLMEEAVERGYAAFSHEEAKRRGVPWLDLVRDQTLKDRLAALVEDFRRRGYVPQSLKAFVTPDEARGRWTALKKFYDKRGHFLVTNGPYQLHQWSAGATVLQAFRDFSYPLGLASFNQYPIPRRAYVSKLDIRDGRLEIQAEVERVFAFQRSYDIVREPLRPKSSTEDAVELPVCSYLVVTPTGDVSRAGTAQYQDAGVFVGDLGGPLKPGLYSIITALYLGGNYVNPEVKMIPHRVGGN
jgi:hypothetical protein